MSISQPEDYRRTLTRKPSVSSGIAESTISFGGLSLFPNPPESIPASPSSSEGLSFTYPSPARSRNPKTFPSTSSRLADDTTSSISPYDWHEGASSIDIDAAEDKLLPTSFITSLLQSSDVSSYKTRPHSLVSDSMSGISEMTYPPSRYPDPMSRPSLPNTAPSTTSPQYFERTRPLGSRPPPTSFSPIPEDIGHVSDDSDTLYSYENHVKPGIVRTSRNFSSPVQGASILGVAPATLHRISATGSEQRTSAYDTTGKNEVSFTPTLRSSAESPRNGRRSNAHQKSQSVHSLAPSMVSRISSTGATIIRAIHWRRRPLPPIPNTPRIPTTAEEQYRRLDASTPLPDLVARANMLNTMLEKGYQPHHSLASQNTTNMGFKGGTTFESDTASLDSRSRSAKPTRELSAITRKWCRFYQGKRRIWIILGIIFIVAVVIGVAVGVSLSKKSSGLPNCGTGLTGMSCTLNSTCVCTSSIDGQCDGLAQALVDLTPTMNRLFDSNYTTNAVYNALWYAQGSGTCAAQAILVDVAPGLSSENFPNRTAWAQSALLWTVIRSQDTGSTITLQSFIKSAPWSTLSATDGPTESSSSFFSTTAAGYIFNLANQTISAPQITFTTNGEPSSDQISRVDDSSIDSLNRIYSYAQASSTQRGTALASYWTNVLSEQTHDLTSFLTVIASSPILLPFDATSELLQELWNSSDSFPPPISCYPKLNSSQIAVINEIENTVFELDSVSESSSFDSLCIKQRPVYGVLDILRLRLPFLDSDNGVAKQAVTVISDVSPRAVVYSGEALSMLPSSSSDSSVSASQSDIREFGTLNHLNHVVLNFLESMPSASVAKAVISFVLSLPTIPPDDTTTLSASLSSIPLLEVAVFGTVETSDVSTVSSSLTTDSGALFFGSTSGDALRNWTITDSKHTLVWTEGATSQTVVDDTMSDSTFEAIWTSAATAIQDSVSNVGVQNITSSFESTGLATDN